MSFETELNESNENEGNSCTTMIFSGNVRKKSDELPTVDPTKSEEFPEFTDNSNSLNKTPQSNNLAPNNVISDNGSSNVLYQHDISVSAPMPQVLPSTSSSSKKSYCGLKNLGNTCYINSCLQALYITNKIRRHLLRKTNNGPLHVALSKLYSSMDKLSQRSNSDCLIIKPEEFINEFRVLKPQFVKHEQHDGQEFLSILLESVHQEANQAKKDNSKNIQIQLNNAEEAWNHHMANVDNSYYSRLFVGQLESILKCLTCGNVSLSWSCFWQLPLHLNDMSNNVPLFKDDQQQPNLTIQDCINEFTALEILSDDCSPFCEKCHHKRASSKQQTICRLPHYLIIHLKRFTHTGTKITRKVTINPILKMPQKTFTIYACVLHRGTESMGHYFTLANVNNEWILFDDESIIKDIPYNQAEVLLQDYAYICFYKVISKTTQVDESQTSKKE